MTWPVKENKRKCKAGHCSNITGVEELTRQRQLELAKAKVEAKQATKQAEYAYKMQKMLDKNERCKERIQERAEKMCLLQLCEEQGMGISLCNGMSGMCTIGSNSFLTPHFPHTPAIHTSLSNQDFSNMFSGISASSSYYHTNSPVPPVSNPALSSGMDEFRFPIRQTLSSSTASGPSSKHTTEQMGSPSSSSMYGSYSGA